MTTIKTPDIPQLCHLPRRKMRIYIEGRSSAFHLPNKLEEFVFGVVRNANSAYKILLGDILVLFHCLRNNAEILFNVISYIKK